MVDSSFSPPTTLGTVRVDQSRLPWSTRSGEKARWKSLPAVRPLYLWYFKYLLPFFGRRVSGHEAAYSYLPASVGAFPPPPEFVTLLERSGFVDVRAVPLSLGIVYLYVGRRRAHPDPRP